MSSQLSPEETSFLCQNLFSTSFFFSLGYFYTAILIWKRASLIYVHEGKGKDDSPSCKGLVIITIDFVDLI